MMEDEAFFISTFEHIGAASIPAPIIYHSKECESYNRQKKIKKKQNEKNKEMKQEKEGIKEENNLIVHGNTGQNAVSKETGMEEIEPIYECINFYKCNGLCHEKKMPPLDDTHLNFFLGETLIYLANFYLQKGVIDKTLFNRLVHSYMMAIFDVLNNMEVSKEKELCIRGKLINCKKENNINILYIEGATIKNDSVFFLTPLLKVKVMEKYI